MTINENGAPSDGNQRREVFYSPIPFLKFVWAATKDYKFKSYN
jgi:hypothetical protein